MVQYNTHHMIEWGGRRGEVEWGDQVPCQPDRSFVTSLGRWMSGPAAFSRRLGDPGTSLPLSFSAARNGVGNRGEVAVSIPLHPDIEWTALAGMTNTSS